MEIESGEIPLPPVLEDPEVYYQLSKGEKKPLKEGDLSSFSKWAVPNCHARPEIHYEFVNESGVTTVFEGTWKNDGFGGDGNEFSFQYRFLGDKFEFSDLLNDYACYGFFTFDGERITFSENKSGSSWTQKYMISETYFDLQVGTVDDIFGRFFKQAS